MTTLFINYESSSIGPKGKKKAPDGPQKCPWAPCIASPSLSERSCLGLHPHWFSREDASSKLFRRLFSCQAGCPTWHCFFFLQDSFIVSLLTPTVFLVLTSVVNRINDTGVYYWKYTPGYSPACWQILGIFVPSRRPKRLYYEPCCGVIKASALQTRNF